MADDTTMSDELNNLTLEEIHDKSIRRIVLRLHKEFPDQPLGSCYYWYLYKIGDYEATRSQLKEFAVSGNILPRVVKNGEMSVSASKVAGKVDLGVFPAELWQNMCSHLDFGDLANLRLTNTALADIAAENMVSRIRFDLSFESFERLARIAKHEHFRKGVRTLSLESALLDDVGCVHRYLAHYDEDHHADGKPQPLGTDATVQAQRLYTRNLAKYNKELETKYAAYRRLLDAQQCLLYGPQGHLFKCIDDFPNLDKVTLAFERCQHSFSERFIEKYSQDCAIRTIVNPKHNTEVLQSMLRPGIKDLFARQILPTFFDGQGGRSISWLQSTFSGLEKIWLHIEANYLFSSQSTISILKNGNLSRAIGFATGLSSLTVLFSMSGSLGSLFDIIAQGSLFPRLTNLSIGSFSAGHDELFEMLKSQPMLVKLDLADVTLTTGNWRSLLMRMRRGLKLTWFWATGEMQDRDLTLYPEDFYDVESWMGGEKFLLSAGIDMYVTESSGIDPVLEEEEEIFEFSFNPVARVENGEFMHFDDLIDEYGPVHDSDFEDDIEGNDIEESDGDDGDAESDDQGMATANEENGDGEDSSEASMVDISTADSDPMHLD